MGALEKNIADRPLCVDLDGTLLRTDLLHEALVKLIKAQPWIAGKLIWWAFKGPAQFKSQVFSRVNLKFEDLPVNALLHEFLIEQKRSGRLLVLASASPQNVIENIAKELDLFEVVMGSTDDLNLKGSNKAQRLTELYGVGNFDYIGDSRVDRVVFKEARVAHAVGSEKLLDNLPASVQKGQIFEMPRLGLSGLFRALRVHQWVKNLLVFVPALMAHTLFDASVFVPGCIAFLALSFMASAIYVLNDLFDLDSDRQHPKKAMRALASGALSIRNAVLVIPFLIVLSVFLTLNLPTAFWAAIGVYLCTTVLYSFYLKQVVLLDIFTLAGLYTLRIIAGGVATATLVSPWLLAFAMFAFLSLACAKRAAELHNLARQELLHAPGRGYTVSDFDQIARFGSSSAYLAVLVLALYINSGVVTQFYSQPWFLWLLCPLLLYWFSRVWLLTARGELNEDPVMFSLTDIQSYLVLTISLVVFYLAI